MAISIKVNIEGQSLVQLTQTMKSLRTEQAALTTEGTSAYEQFEQQINDVNAALLTQIGEYDTANKSVVTLKQEFKALKDLQAQAGSSEEMVKFASAAGQANDKMKDVNEQAAIFSGGSAFEQAGTALGQVGDSLMNLDFEGASEKAKTLTEITTKMSFSGATAGLKNLGTTFIQLGKALLTNPIFLLAVVIVAIGAAVMALMNKFGLLKPILDGIKATIGFITDAFAALTDALGLSNNAEIKASKEAKEASEERLSSMKEELKMSEEQFQKTANWTEEEKVLYEEATGQMILSAAELSIFRIQTAEQAAIAAEDARQAAIAEYGEDSDEYKASLKEKEKAERDLTAVRVNEELARYNTSRSIDDQLKMLQAGAISSEKGRAKAFLAIQQQEALAKLDTAIQNQQNLIDISSAPEEAAIRAQAEKDITKLRAARVLTIKAFNQKEKEIEVKAAESSASVRKTSNDNAQSDLEKRIKEALDKLKKENQLKLNDLKEGSAEYLAELKAGLDRELAFVKSKSKGLKQDKLDVQLFEDDINKKKAAAQKTFDDQELAAANKLAVDKAELAIREAKTFAAQKAAEIELIKANLAISLQSVEADSDAKKILEADAATATAGIRAEVLEEAIKTTQARTALEASIRETERSAAEFDLERFKGTQKEKIAAIQEYQTLLIANLEQAKNEQLAALNAELAALEAKRKAAGEGGPELTNDEVTRVQEIGAEIASSEEGFRQAKIIAEEQTQLKIDELRKASRDKAIEDASAMAAGAAEALSMISAIGQSNLAIQENQMNARHAQELSNLEEGSEAYEAAKKRQLGEEEAFAKKKFEIDKKQQIAAAVIQGIQAVLSAFSSGSAIPVVGAVTGPAFAALAAIAAAKNIQAIKSTTFQGGGGAPAAPAAGGGGIPGVGGGGNDSAVPSFNLFGQGNNANTTNASSNVMGGNQGAMVVKAIVVESDITNSQANVARYKESATL